MVPVIQEMLRALVPPDHFDQCSRMRQAVVTEVQEVANMALWIQYKTKRQQIAERLSGSRDCPWASVVAPGVDVLRGYLPHAVLETFRMSGTPVDEEGSADGLSRPCEDQQPKVAQLLANSRTRVQP